MSSFATRNRGLIKVVLLAAVMMMVFSYFKNVNMNQQTSLSDKDVEDIVTYQKIQDLTNENRELREKVNTLQTQRVLQVKSEQTEKSEPVKAESEEVKSEPRKSNISCVLPKLNINNPTIMKFYKGQF